MRNKIFLMSILVLLFSVTNAQKKPPPKKKPGTSKPTYNRPATNSGNTTARPSLVRPASGARINASNGQRLLFQWNGVAYASNYQLKVRHSSGYELINTTGNRTSYSYTFNSSLPANYANAPFQFQVRAYVKGKWREWATRTFYLYRVSYIAQLQQPNNYAALSNGDTRRTSDFEWRFQWAPVQGAQQYRIEIIAPYGSFRNQVVNGNYYSVRMRDPISQGYLNNWNWRVQALVNGSWQQWSETRYFNVNQPRVISNPIVAPRLSQPYNNATLQNRVNNQIQWYFDWEGVQGAQQYELEVRRSGSQNPLVRQVVNRSSYNHSRSGSYVTNANLNGWWWRVRALIDGQWGPWSAKRYFNVRALNSGNAGGRSNPTYVTFRNSGAYVAKYEIIYMLNGQRRNWNSGNVLAGQSKVATIPAGATALTAGGFAKTVTSWKNIRSVRISQTGRNYCYKSTGSLFSLGWTSCQ